MKCKVMRSQGSTVLKFASSAVNPVDIQVLRIFEQGTPQIFLPFTAMPVSPTSTEVHYDVTRLVTLSEHLRTLQGEDALCKVFGNLKQLIDACVNLRLPLKNVEFDSNLVYYDSWADTVRFVYLPFEGIAPDVRRLRSFFEGIGGQVCNADAGMSELLNEYNGFFVTSANFNPADFAKFLGSVSGPVTQVDWASVQASSSARKADSNTTALQPSVLDAAVIHDRPASAVSGYAGTSTDPEKGAHARVDPGTTVLGALTFDFDETADGTEVLGESEPSPVSPPSEQMPKTASEATAEPVFEPEPEPAPALAPESAHEQTPELESDSGHEPSAAVRATPESRQQPTHARPSKPQYWLHRRSTDEKVRITGERFVVGKSKYSTYQVRHTTTVSRSHAIFSCDEEGCWIEDDGSRNGTYLDNRRIEPHEREKLEDGMVIRMSDEEFTFSKTIE